MRNSLSWQLDLVRTYLSTILATCRCSSPPQGRICPWGGLGHLLETLSRKRILHHFMSTGATEKSLQVYVQLYISRIINLVPWPLTAFQCSVRKPWYAKARDWRFSWNWSGINFISHRHVYKFGASYLDIAHYIIMHACVLASIDIVYGCRQLFL